MRHGVDGNSDPCAGPAAHRTRGPGPGSGAGHGVSGGSGSCSGRGTNDCAGPHLGAGANGNSSTRARARTGARTPSNGSELAVAVVEHPAGVNGSGRAVGSSPTNELADALLEGRRRYRETGLVRSARRAVGGSSPEARALLKYDPLLRGRSGSRTRGGPRVAGGLPDRLHPARPGVYGYRGCFLARRHATSRPD